MPRNVNLALTANNNQGQSQHAEGRVVFDATAIVATDYVEFDLGFQPTYVEFLNANDRIAVEHYKGMADNSCLKTAAAGTRTLEVTGGNGGITLTTNGFRVSQNATLAVIAASKTCYYRASA